MAVLRLSDADRSRRDKLVGMLGSSFDGERLNALGLLQRMADNYKVPIHELLLADEKAHRAEHAAREAQFAHPAEPDSMTPKLPPDWRELFATAEQLNRSSFVVTGWEANFVAGLLTAGRATRRRNSLSKSPAFSKRPPHSAVGQRALTLIGRTWNDS